MHVNVVLIISKLTGVIFMKYIVDRIEEQFVVLQLQNKKTVTVPLVLFENLVVKEGDIIYITIDHQQTESEKNKSCLKLHSLFSSQKQKKR